MIGELPEDNNPHSDSQPGVDERFDEMASGYDRLRFIRHAASRLVALAGIQTGMSVLDTATGTGRAALDAACAAAPAVFVAGIDLSSGMLARARHNMQAENCEAARRIGLCQGDALSLPFPGAAFDRVVCASGLFFMPDMLAALVAWQRVLKPGGQAAFCAFARGLRQPMSELFEKRWSEFGLARPDAPPGMRQLSRLENGAALLRAAGFKVTAAQTEQLGYYLPSAEDYWEEERRGLRRDMLSMLTREQLEQFRQAHLEEASTFITDQGLWIDVPVNFWVGQKA